MWPHYVYLHRRADDGRVFYVGKGSINRRKCARAHERFGRTKWWNRVVAKHGFLVEIAAFFSDESAAHDYERAMIAEYGRQNLVNLTDGGEGCHGLVPSQETRSKLSLAASRPRSEVWVKAIRVARKNGGNGGVVKRGDKLPDSWRAAISAGQCGPNNYMRGRTGALHPNSRNVFDRSTGISYDSVQAAADALGFKMKTLYNWLSGHRPNPTTLEFS